MKNFDKFKWNKVLKDATWTHEEISDNKYYIDEENVKKAIENGADIDSWLLWSVRNGYSDLIEYLIEHGADVNTISSRGEFSLLMTALLDNYLDIAHILIKTIDLNLKNFQGYDYYSLGFPSNKKTFIHFNYDRCLKNNDVDKINHLDKINKYIILNRFKDIKYKDIDKVIEFYLDSFTDEEMKFINKIRSIKKFKI